MDGHCCHHCCQPLDSETSLGLPYVYKDMTFYTEYEFCSWSCMKTYNQCLNDSLKNQRSSLISLMWKMLNPGMTFNIAPAPPREMLRMFGGTMTIEEFKNNQTIIRKVPYNMISKIKTYDNSANFTWNTSEDAKNMYNQFQVESVTEEPLKLQRKNVKKTNQHTLENSMGIFTSSKP